jgi:hypothetical protein
VDQVPQVLYRVMPHIPTALTDQIKMLAGWQFPIAVLAAYAWHDGVSPWLEHLASLAPMRRLRVSARTLGTATLIALILPTNAYLYVWRIVELRRHQSPYYLHRDEISALDWLARQDGPREVVLAPPAIGQFVPNYGRARAYLAHWAMTNRFYERSGNVNRFLSPSTPDRWRDELMSREGVTMILRSGTPAELAAMYDPAGSPLFRELLALPRAQLYRVRRSETSRAPDRFWRSPEDGPKPETHSVESGGHR